MIETVLRVERDRAQSLPRRRGRPAGDPVRRRHDQPAQPPRPRRARRPARRADRRELVRHRDSAPRTGSRRGRRSTRLVGGGEEAVERYESQVVTRRGRRRSVAWQAPRWPTPRAAWSWLAVRPGHHRARAGRAGAAPARLLRPADRAAQPLAVRVASARRSHARAAAPARGRAAARRPRQLQARQRLARPRRRRPAAAPHRRAAARHRGRARPARPPRRRRVRAPVGRPPARRAGAARERPTSSCAALRAVPGRRRRVPRRGQHRHLALPRDADGAEALLQHADVAMYQSKGRRARGRDGLRGRDPRPARASVALGAAAARDRPRRARAALPADRLDGERPAALDGGAAALAATPSAGSCRRTLHPGRRGDGPARPDRRVGVRRAGRADRRPGATGLEPQCLQRLPARAAPARLRRRPGASACAAPASTRAS